MIARIAECTLLLRLGQAVKVKAKVAGEDWGPGAKASKAKGITSTKQPSTMQPSAMLGKLFLSVDALPASPE